MISQPLGQALLQARPKWTKRDLETVRQKLSKVGITTSAELAAALSMDNGLYLNRELRDAGEKVFTGEAYQALKDYFGAIGPAAAALSAAARETRRQKHEPPAAKAAAAKVPAAGDEGIPDLDALLAQLDQDEAKDDSPKPARARASRPWNPKPVARPVLETYDSEVPVGQVRVDQLDDPREFADLQSRLAGLERMTVTKLHLEYQRRGYASFDGLSRQELIDGVKDVLIIEAQNMQALQEACRKRGYMIAVTQPKEEVLQLFAHKSWEDVGLPVSRLPDMERARELLDEVLRLRQLRLPELVAKSRELGLPTDAHLGNYALTAQLTKALAWRELPTEELRLECRTYGISIDTGDDRSHDTVHEALFNKLVMFFGNAMEEKLVAMGLPVEILGGHSNAEKVFQKVENLQVMGVPSLRSEWRKIRFDFDEKADRQALADRLKDVFIWQAMPLHDLKLECQDGGLETSGGSPQLIKRLLYQAERLHIWEAEGIPAQCFARKGSAPDLIMQCEYLEQADLPSLLERYTEMGFPEEEAMSRKELTRCLQKLSAWQMMSLDMLREECKVHNLTVAAQDKDDEEEQREQLVQKLMKNERLQAWEKRGFAARRIVKFQKVLQIVSNHQTYSSMPHSDLLELYSKTGLPMGDGTHDMAAVLKSVMIWEMLPIREVHKDCATRGIKTQSDTPGIEKGNERSELISVLAVHLFKDFYESRGVPVDRLGADVCQVTNLWLSFEKQDATELAATCLKFGIPSPDDAEKQDMLAKLQDVAKWIWLPLSELWKEVENTGMPMRGLTLKMPEDELKDILITRMMLHWNSEPVDQESDCPECEPDEEQLSPWKMPSVWKYIELMRDPVMMERLCAIPKKPLPRDINLPVEAALWRPLEAALFVLSSGLFAALAERQEISDAGIGDNEALISVTCPTSERRQNFHPLLYESFCNQRYEPKELIVVETGTRPSRFFLERAKEDSRIVYRHFKVDDSKAGLHVETERKHKFAWSLGLKRNLCCCLAKGAAIAQFDDDDLYASNYLSYMFSELKDTSSRYVSVRGPTLAPAAVKLSEWHLLDIGTLRFGYLDCETDQSVPLKDRRGWLYGWGFSYMFTRTAWELYPFPDVEFAEDAGFYEGLMARGVPIGLVRYPPNDKNGLVAHSHHANSTSGGSGVIADGAHTLDKAVVAPKAFTSLMDTVKKVHGGYAPAGLKPGLIGKKFANKGPTDGGFGGAAPMKIGGANAPGQGLKMPLFKKPMGLAGGGLVAPAGLLKPG